MSFMTIRKRAMVHAHRLRLSEEVRALAKPLPLPVEPRQYHPARVGVEAQLHRRIAFHLLSAHMRVMSGAEDLMSWLLLKFVLRAIAQPHTLECNLRNRDR